MYTYVVDYGEGEGEENNPIFCSQEEVLLAYENKRAQDETMIKKTMPGEATTEHNPNNTLESKLTNKTMKKQSGMRARKDRPKLIVGKDIGIEQIPKILNQALVRRFWARTVSRDSLQHWIVVNWDALLGYTLVFYTFP